MRTLNRSQVLTRFGLIASKWRFQAIKFGIFVRDSPFYEVSASSELSIDFFIYENLKYQYHDPIKESKSFDPMK
jgi:hypothetical protein